MKTVLLLFASLLIAGCSQKQSTLDSNLESATQNLYATKGAERRVSFTAYYQTDSTNLAAVQANPSAVARWEIAQTVKFLFGPLVFRELGGPQRGEIITIRTKDAKLQNGFVHVPYDYSALWLVSRDFPQNQMSFPLPYQSDMQQTPKWVSCGDADPEHQGAGFFWYFWDPTRYQCDQKLGVHYQNVALKFNEETVQTTLSYPEYSRMIQTINGEKVLQMTFGFGYVTDVENPNPFLDYDYGMREFQRFEKRTEKMLSPLGFVKSPIMQSEYDGSPTLAVGSRFTGIQNGVKIVVSVVASAGVDQMMLFAESYAARKEGFFGWFGHSRVGSGFDAQSFESIMYSNPQRYSLSRDYQMIYWAGCNSYSYYTLAFFDQKAKLNPTKDPKGTKNLDIIS
ncbi:MAG: hypothetical protein ACXWC9_01915, partial [Pseudobdellovibrionaceae bacterium]